MSCPIASGEAQVGGNHGGTTAIGYATIDVAATCSVALPIDPTYFACEILFDNVLIGDYQDINQSTVTGNYAGGNPLVHIRAIPEGGGAGLGAVATNLPFTFYDRYTIGTLSRTFDRRQPLPQALQHAGSAVQLLPLTRSTRSGVKVSRPAAVPLRRETGMLA